MEINHNVCIGAATCVLISPDIFKLDSENKAEATLGEGADQSKILLAAQFCFNGICVRAG